MYYLNLAILLLSTLSCQPSTEHIAQSNTIPSSTSIKTIEPIINSSGRTILERFNPPSGYVRQHCSADSFGEYLRNLPLKPNGSPVLFYDGSLKNSNKHAAVLDMDIGDRDLQQCADAIMRIRAEYFFNRKEYDQISYHFVNSFNADYSR